MFLILAPHMGFKNILKRHIFNFRKIIKINIILSIFITRNYLISIIDKYLKSYNVFYFFLLICNFYYVAVYGDLQNICI